MSFSITEGIHRFRVVFVTMPLLVGSVIGVFLLYPVNEFVYYHEHYNEEFEHGTATAFVLSQMAESLRGGTVGKTIFYATFGGLLGVLAGAIYGNLYRRTQQVEQLQSALQQDVNALIAQGESGRVEFKSSLRWDLRKGERNRALEAVVLKTLAGFMNADGGTLLIGVTDDGQIVGIEHDFQTLRKPSCDGFEQAIMTMVATKLGTNHCQLLQIIFHSVQNQSICRVITAPSPRPVFLTYEGGRKFYLRTGGSTREMDVQEAVEFIATRWPR